MGRLGVALGRTGVAGRTLGVDHQPFSHFCVDYTASLRSFQTEAG